MLWVLKRTVLMRRFFWAHQNLCFKLWVGRDFQFYAQKFCLSKLMIVRSSIFVVCIQQKQVFL